jgi:hypothetical protein
VARFQDAYEAWIEVPFPIGDANDRLGELHDDVALADTWVAESVVPYFKEKRFVPAVPDVLQELRTLRERAVALGEADGAPEYVTYIDLLANVYQSFLEEGGETGPA